jgi:hypothetical protein
MFAAWCLTHHRSTAGDTSKIVDYVTSELLPVFGDLPECLTNTQRLLCGLSCDPRQSEYVDLYTSPETGNTTTRFYLWYRSSPTPPCRMTHEG